MFDVDHFKQVNDSHGHDVGDALLKAVGETLVQGLRSVDIVGRWGGEEFLVSDARLNALGVGGSRRTLPRFDRAILGDATERPGSSVTASIGATVLSHTDTAEVGRFAEWTS